MADNKIAIISNIKGNIYAFYDFLNNSSIQSQIKHIVNLGNFVGDGGFSAKIFDIITTDNRFINILGSNEKRVISSPDDKNAILIREELGEERLNILRNMPTIKVLEIFGKKFLLASSSRNLNSISFDKRLKFLFMDEYKDTDYSQQHFIFDYTLYGCSGVCEISTYIRPLYKNRSEVFISPGNLYMYTINTISYCLIEFNEFNEDIIMKKGVTNTNLMIEKLVSRDKKNIELYDYGHFNVDGDKGTLVIDSIYDESKFSEYYREFWEESITYMLEESFYVGFCVFKGTENILNEIRNSLASYSEVLHDKNKIYIEGEINDSIKKVLLASYLDNKNSFKWFEVCLLDKKKELLFSCIKYDGRYQFCNLNEEKISYIKNNIYKSDRLIYRVYEG